MRLTKEELEKVKQKYGVTELYSWSKINTFLTSPYEFFLSYVLHEKPDKDNCAYAPLGGLVHTIIEDLYSDKITYNEMLDAFEDAWITVIDIAKLYFYRSDESKDKSIGEKYKESLRHFFNNHQKIKNKVEIERFLTAKIGDYVLQGYADAITKDSEGNFVIIDWKTSSMFSEKALKEKSGQLCVYAIALNQLGVQYDKIKLCFCMLKYCNVEVSMKNGKIKTRTIERHKLGESLYANVKMWLKDSNCNEDRINDYLKQLIDTNSIKCLPKNVQEKFIISDCYLYVPLSEELVNYWKKIIINTIKDINFRIANYKETKSEGCFWDSEENVKEQSYYFANLMSYSALKHKPYKAYLDRLEEKKNGNDLFANVGVDVNRNETITSKIQKQNSEIDLSWLDALV